MDRELVSVTEYQQRVTDLMDHIFTTLPQAALDQIDDDLWRAVADAEPEVVYSE